MLQITTGPVTRVITTKEGWCKSWQMAMRAVQPQLIPISHFLIATICPVVASRGAIGERICGIAAAVTQPMIGERGSQQIIPQSKNSDLLLTIP